MAILPMTAMRSIRGGDARQVASLAKSTFVFSLLSLLVIIFGFGILGMSEYDISVTTPWILWSLIAYVIALLLNLFVVVPSMRRAGRSLAAAGAEGQTAEGTGTGYGLISATSGISTLLLVLVVVLMVWKP